MHATRYELKDARTGVVILALPVVPGQATEQSVRSTAGTQARRFAAGGTWVLLSGGERHLLFVGERVYAACAGCGHWFDPGRGSRRELCVGCREQEAEAAATEQSGKRPRRLRAAPDMQLALPEI